MVSNHKNKIEKAHDDLKKKKKKKKVTKSI